MKTHIYRINWKLGTSGEWMWPAIKYYIEEKIKYKKFFNLIPYYEWEPLDEEYDYKYRCSYDSKDKVNQFIKELAEKHNV